MALADDPPDPTATKEVTMTNLQTNASLLRALQRATSRPISVEEVERQRVSFIMGSLKPDNAMTRSRVEELLSAQAGRKDVK